MKNNAAPSSVLYACLTLALTILITFVVNLIDLQSGALRQPDFALNLFFYPPMCVILYFIYQGKAWARNVYAGASLLGAALLVFSGLKQTEMELVAGFLIIPMELVALYVLFQRSNAAWFKARGIARQPK